MPLFLSPRKIGNHKVYRKELIKMTKIFFIVLPGILTFVLMYLFVRFFDEKIIKYIGYEFTFYFLPLIIYLVIMIVFAIFRLEIDFKILLNYWWLILVGIIISYSPTIFLFVGTWLFYR